MKIKASKEIVKHYLEKYPHLRDDDNKLIATIWLADVKKLGFVADQINGFELLGLISRGKLSNPESIRRSRQQLQEQNISLRGTSYKAKQKHQSEVKAELGYKP